MKLLMLFAFLACLTDAVAVPDTSTSTHTAPGRRPRGTLTLTATANVQTVVDVAGTDPADFIIYTAHDGTTTSTSYVFTSTITQTTYISTTTSTSTIPGPTTTTVPTPAGFTPILLEVIYTDNLVLETVTSTYTNTRVTATSTITYTEPNFDYSYTDIVTSATISYLFTRTTVTATTTTAPAVATQYAACRRNNLATRIPTGENITVFELDPNSSTFAVHADSAQACCAICQATNLCVGGLWTADIGSGECYYFARIPNSPNGTCDGSRALNSFASSVNPPSPFHFTAFNGPCGQLQWDFMAGN